MPGSQRGARLKTDGREGKTYGVLLKGLIGVIMMLFIHFLAEMGNSAMIFWVKGARDAAITRESGAHCGWLFFKLRACKRMKNLLP